MVILYSRTSCPYCTRAKTLLESMGVQYQERLLGRDFTRDQLLEMVPAAKTYPVVMVNGSFIGGFEDLHQKLVEERGSFGKTFLTE